MHDDKPIPQDPGNSYVLRMRESLDRLGLTENQPASKQKTSPGYEKKKAESRQKSKAIARPALARA